MSRTTAAVGDTALPAAHEPGAAPVPGALAPVAEGLLGAAAAGARRTRAAADADVDAEIASARAKAAHLVAEARAEGERAAARIAASQLTAARQGAREAVLAARRQTYENLRRDAVDALVRAASTARAAWLGQRLAELAAERLGPAARVSRTGRGGLTAVAESGNRRAVIGPEELVDEVLATMGTQIEDLWR